MTTQSDSKNINSSTTVPTANSTGNSTGPDIGVGFQATLLIIYCITLLGGAIGVFYMIRFLRATKNKRTITTVSIINLLLSHGIFLLTVPFRIDYYAIKTWHYSFDFCKLVSITIHTHLYISFFFYVAILVVRLLLPSLSKRDNFRPLNIILASASVWIFFFSTIFPLLWMTYGEKGKHEGKYQRNKCFDFDEEIQGYVKGVNITISCVVMLVCLTILVIQIKVLTGIVQKNNVNSMSQPDVRAQIKNLTFLTIMIVCFLPYHVFRIYYVLNINPENKLNDIKWHNEVYLAITTLCCLDLITFLAV